MSNLASGGALWTTQADGSDAAALTPVVLVDDGTGDLVFSVVGPPRALMIDGTGTGVYDVTLLPTATTGPQLSAFRDTAGNIIIF